MFWCASVEFHNYRAKSQKEKVAFSLASETVLPSAVKADFSAHEEVVMAWGGIIKDIQFKETEHTIQVAFEVEHCTFDWRDHGGRIPYTLYESEEGVFRAGWTVNKPASVSHLEKQAKPGYMILVYCKPYRMSNDMVQLSAISVRPIQERLCLVVPAEPEALR